MTETFERVRKIISTLFNVEESTITETSSTATVPEWDSMGQLMLVLELEQQFEIAIDPEIAEKLTNVPAIVRLVDGVA